MSLINFGKLKNWTYKQLETFIIQDIFFGQFQLVSIHCIALYVMILIIFKIKLTFLIKTVKSELVFRAIQINKLKKNNIR